MMPEEIALIELSANAEMTASQVSKLAVAQAYFLAAADTIMKQLDVLSQDSLAALKLALEKHNEFHYSMGAQERYRNSNLNPKA